MVSNLLAIKASRHPSGYDQSASTALTMVHERSYARWGSSGNAGASSLPFVAKRIARLCRCLAIWRRLRAPVTAPSGDGRLTIANDIRPASADWLRLPLLKHGSDKKRTGWCEMAIDLRRDDDPWLGELANHNGKASKPNYRLASHSKIASAAGDGYEVRAAFSRLAS